MEEVLIKDVINNFTVILVNRPSDIATVKILVNAGSMNEQTPADYGVAHFLEHMFFKGTKRKNHKQIRDELTELGTHNASTWMEKTGCYINCLNKNVKSAFDLLLEMVFESNLLEEEFEKERTVIIEELQMYEDDPATYFYYRNIEDMFGEKSHSIIGTKESIKNMTLDRLNKFKDNNYDHSNMIFLVVGNAEEIGTIKNFSLALNNYTTPDRAKRNCPTLFFDTKNLHLSHSAKQAQIDIVYHSHPLNSTTNQLAIVDIFTDILGGGGHSRLFSKIREELGLAYSTGAYYYKIGNNLAISSYALLDKKNVEKVIETINGCIKSMISSPPSEKEILLSKKNVVFSFNKELETTAGYSSSQFENYFIHGFVKPEERIKSLQNVTRQELKDFGEWIFGTGMPKITVMTEKK